MTEEQRSAMRMLETDLSASYGARHESYDLTFADFVAGVAPLFTLQPDEVVTLAWMIVTAAFNGTPTPTRAYIVPTSAPTFANAASEDLVGNVSGLATPKVASNTVYATGASSTFAIAPVSAAVSLSLLIIDVPDPSVGSAAGAATVHVIITTTA